jgi:hypothetical protein
MTNTTQEELLPCPCCGGKVLEDTDDHGYSCFYCDLCELRSRSWHCRYDDKRATAITDWNRRTPPAEQPACALSLAHELEGIAADVDAGIDFDVVCRRTLQRVIDELRSKSKQPAAEGMPDAEINQIAKDCDFTVMSITDPSAFIQKRIEFARCILASKKGAKCYQ